MYVYLYSVIHMYSLYEYLYKYFHIAHIFYAACQDAFSKDVQYIHIYVYVIYIWHMTSLKTTCFVRDAAFTSFSIKLGVKYLAISSYHTTAHEFIKSKRLCFPRLELYNIETLRSCFIYFGNESLTQ